MIKSKIIIIIAPTERYRPSPNSLSCFLMERTSLRKLFFSDELRLDLSIAFISSNLSVKVLAFSDSTGFGATEVVGVGAVAAFDWYG